MPEDGLPESAGLSVATKPSTGEPTEVASLATITKPDPSSGSGSKPSELALCESGRGVSLPPYSMDFYLSEQTSPLSEALDLMRSLVMKEEQLKEICPRGNNKVIIYFLIS